MMSVRIPIWLAGIVAPSGALAKAGLRRRGAAGRAAEAAEAREAPAYDTALPCQGAYQCQRLRLRCRLHLGYQASDPIH